MPDGYRKHAYETDTEETIDIGLDPPSYKTAIKDSNGMNTMPIQDTRSRRVICADGVCGCMESCSNFWCCCLKTGRMRACGLCSTCLLFLVFTIVILVLVIIQHPHKAKELFYTTGHSSWTDYYNLQNAIAENGANVCDIAVVPRLYPGCSSSVILFGRSGTPRLRAIVEEGTRIATMDRYFQQPFLPFGDFKWDLDESWFHHSSLALYDYNLDHPKQVFNVKKTLFLVRDPFDSAIDLFYRQYWSRRPIHIYKGDPVTTFANHKDVMTFAIKEFKEWNDFMVNLHNFTKQNDDFQIIWYDDLDSETEWTRVTTQLFTFIRDADYYPGIQQSLRCVNKSGVRNGPSYLKSLPPRDKIFSLDDRKVLCPMIIKNWEHERWGDFCDVA